MLFRSKNLKKRLKSLGVDLSLSHAYEGVAAVLGHPTWNVLSGSLLKSTDTPKEDYLDIYPSEALPLLVLFARPELHRSLIEGMNPNSIPQQSGRQVIRNVLTSYRPQPVTRDSVDQSTTCTRVSFSGERPMPISIFDTALGQRLPTEAHRFRIALFLATVIRIVHPLDATPTIIEQLEVLVDALFRHHSDIDRGSSPFKRVSSSTTHAELELAGIHMNEGETWWDAVDRASAAGNQALSRAAQSNALPRLEHIIPFVRNYESAPTDSGETLSDLLARAVSFAYRTYPCFTFTESRFGQEERSKYDRIDFAVNSGELRDSKVLSALYMAAFNAAAIEADDDLSSGHGSGIRSTIVLEKTETSIAAVNSLETVTKLLEHASTGKRRCIALTESTGVASIAYALRAAFAVTLCSNALFLDAISDLLRLSPEDGDAIEAAMNEPTSYKGSVPVISTRRVNRRTQHVAGHLKLR